MTIRASRRFVACASAEVAAHAAAVRTDRVADGRIRAIEAVMMNRPLKDTLGWPTSAR